MLPTLYEIAAEYRADIDRLADLDLPPETVTDTLEGLSGALEAKATNIASLVKHLDLTSAAMKDAEATLYKRRKAIESRIEHINKYVLNVMVIKDIQKIDTPFFSIKIAKNPPSVEVFDQAQVPAHFFRQPETPPPVVDKRSIMESIKHGEEVAGCRLTQSLSLRIK